MSAHQNLLKKTHLQYTIENSFALYVQILKYSVKLCDLINSQKKVTVKKKTKNQCKQCPFSLWFDQTFELCLCLTLPIHQQL